VPHLASHLLSLAIDRLRCDWPQKYGFSLCLLETFVDTSRFAGTCYRAANFKYVGDTTGRSRNDTHHSIQKPIKAIYLYRRQAKRSVPSSSQMAAQPTAPLLSGPDKPASQASL
jgi:hypothetical protein